MVQPGSQKFSIGSCRHVMQGLFDESCLYGYLYLNEFYLDVSSVGRLQNVLQIHV